MKYLRTLAGMSIVFVIVFMVIALFRYQHDEDMSMLPSQFEVSGSLDWSWRAERTRVLSLRLTRAFA